MGSILISLVFGTASLYFGAHIVAIAPAFFRLVSALMSGKAKWPGPRIHDPSTNARNVRERLGVGYENLFSSFVSNMLGVIAAFLLSVFTFMSRIPQMAGHILITSSWVYVLSLAGLVGGGMALVRIMHYRTLVNALLSDLAGGAEPKEVETQSAEAEYAIEHPLAGRRAERSDTARALNLFYESVVERQSGHEPRALALYQEALKVDPDLHAHSRDALLRLAPSCRPADAGAIYYWLGIHAEYLQQNPDAAIWYEKAIDAFHAIGYPNREARAHCNLGNVKTRLGDSSGIAEFKRAIALNPGDGIAHINLGKAYYMADESDLALDEFAEAVWADADGYGPVVISFLRGYGYTWEEDLQKIGQRVARKQGLDIDALTADERDNIAEAYRYFEMGNRLFQAGRCKEALEQFERGKFLTGKIPGCFMGVSMTIMQMIELGMIPEDQIPFYLERAEQNLAECLRIAPTNPDYLHAKKLIGERKQKYHL